MTTCFNCIVTSVNCRTILLLVFFLALTSCSTTTLPSSVVPKEINLDFKTKSFTSDLNRLQSIKPGDFYQLKIDNINLRQYKVSVGKRDSSTAKPLELPAFATLPFDALAGVVAGLSPLEGAVATWQKVNIPAQFKEPSADAQDKTAQERLARMRQQREDEIRIAKETNERVDRQRAAKQFLSNQRRDIEALLPRLLAKKSELGALIFNANQLVLQSQVSSGVLTFPSPIGIRDVTVKLATVRADLEALLAELQDKHRAFVSGRTRHISIIEKDEALGALDKQIELSYNEFKKTLAEWIEITVSESVLKLLSALASAANVEDNSTYTSLPMQFIIDQSNLDIEIVPRVDGSSLQSYKTRIQFPIDFHDDFWGITSGFYVGTAVSEAYSIRKDIPVAPATDTTYTFMKESPGAIEFGFNAMLRYGHRIHKKLYWHVGLGPGLSVSDKVRPRMLLGGGLGFGQKHAILIDIGMTMGYYDVRSVVYSSDSYTTLPTNYMVSQFKTGAYFSISYLFLKD